MVVAPTCRRCARSKTDSGSGGGLGRNFRGRARQPGRTFTVEAPVHDVASRLRDLPSWQTPVRGQSRRRSCGVDLNNHPVRSRHALATKAVRAPLRARPHAAVAFRIPLKHADPLLCAPCGTGTHKGLAQLTRPRRLLRLVLLVRPSHEAGLREVAQRMQGNNRRNQDVDRSPA